MGEKQGTLRSLGVANGGQLPLGVRLVGPADGWGGVHVQRAVAVDPPGQKAVGDQVQNAGAADAHRGLVSDGFYVDLVPFVDSHLTNRPRLCPHSRFADGPFQSGTGRTGTHQQKILAAEGDFPVGADVQKQRRVRSCVQVRHQKAGGDVPTQIISHRRHTKDTARKIQANVPCFLNAGIVKDRGVRNLEYLPGFAGKKKVYHGGVAAHGQQENF